VNYPRNTCLYKQAGADTYRASSTSVLNTYGTNLQNIEKDSRKLYWADDNKILCQADQSGAEALIVAYEAPAGKFRDLFLYGVKPHVFVAMNVFLETWGVKLRDIDLAKFTTSPIKDLKSIPGWKELDGMIKASDNWGAQERYYYIAKMICHASNYGMQAGAFQLNVLEKSRGKIVLSKQQAEKYLNDYHALFPEIRKWHKQVERQLWNTRMLFNLQGYPRQFTGLIGEHMFKEAYAFTPQSTVGCITHIAITLLQRFIEDNKLPWDILGNCHDSYLAQCPVGQEKLLAQKMLEFMQQDLTSSSGEKFKMRAEAQVGRNWAPYKKDKNPDGLQEIKF